MKRVNNRAGMLAIAIGVGLGWTAVATAQDMAPAGDIEAGQAKFETHGCYTCHGHSGQGSSAGPRLTAPALPYDAVHEQLRNPRNLMPPYEEAILPEQDVADIYAFLSSVPEPPAASDIPLLQGYLNN